MAMCSQDDPVFCLWFPCDRHEQPINKAAVAPGPGEYPLPSSLGGRSHSIAKRLTPSSSRQQEQLPGPAEYEVFDSTIGVAGKLHKL